MKNKVIIIGLVFLTIASLNTYDPPIIHRASIQEQPMTSYFEEHGINIPGQNPTIYDMVKGSKYFYFMNYTTANRWTLYKIDMSQDTYTPLPVRGGFAPEPMTVNDISVVSHPNGDIVYISYWNDIGEAIFRVNTTTLIETFVHSDILIEKIAVNCFLETPYYVDIAYTDTAGRVKILWVNGTVETIAQGAMNVFELEWHHIYYALLFANSTQINIRYTGFQHTGEWRLGWGWTENSFRRRYAAAGETFVGADFSRQGVSSDIVIVYSIKFGDDSGKIERANCMSREITEIKNNLNNPGRVRSNAYNHDFWISGQFSSSVISKNTVYSAAQGSGGMIGDTFFPLESFPTGYYTNVSLAAYPQDLMVYGNDEKIIYMSSFGLYVVPANDNIAPLKPSWVSVNSDEQVYNDNQKKFYNTTYLGNNQYDSYQSTWVIHWNAAVDTYNLNRIFFYEFQWISSAEAESNPESLFTSAGSFFTKHTSFLFSDVNDFQFVLRKGEYYYFRVRGHDTPDYPWKTTGNWSDIVMIHYTDPPASNDEDPSGIDGFSLSIIGIAAIIGSYVSKRKLKTD